MANQRFSIYFDFNANMGPIKSSVAELQKELNGLNLPANMTANFGKVFTKLAAELSDFEALTKSSFNNMSDVNKAQTAFARIQKLLNQLGIESAKIKGLDPNKLIPPEVTKRVADLTAKWAALDAQSKKKDGFAEKIKAQSDAIRKQQQEIDRLVTKRNALAAENKAMGAQKGAQEAKKNATQKELDAAVAQRTALEGTRGGKSSAEYAALGQEITRLGKVVNAANTEIARLTTGINKNKTAMIGLDGDIANATQEINNMQQELGEMQSFDIDVTELTKLREELAKILNLNLDEIPTDLEEIKKAIAGIPSKNLQQVAENGKKVGNAMAGVEASSTKAANGIRDIVYAAQGADRAASDMENLKNQVLHFFSITNSVQLFKRAINSALNTVKELDATMTEAAVVTDFSVGDMWSKLPQYAAEANKLGVSINNLYGATTLYYQQGLKTNEAMALGIETMKMARIAGMESTDATKAMTAALRGFNMELNETSATRVNDVYSQLAAVTAADVNQISTAMEKTASIAASANMEFETTAALLSQIIETTQEAPETAGTAMKTIIARFSEVKKLQNQGESSGTDSEGEEIDVNKIQTALRTVGISMEGFFAGTQGLDSILLELAEKWEDLDFQTQRYIATTAAGSRQQSRFIAMMSDYSRTTELVAAAQDSAGASQRQFNKTQDSMEAKLQKLQNAWDQFLMGLADSEILKGAIDTLTFIVDGINKVTDALSGGSGLIKSIISLVTVIGALKIGKSLLGNALGWFGTQVGIKPQQPSGTTQNNIGGQVMPNAQQQGQQSGQLYGKGLMSGILQSLENSRFAIGQKLKEKTIGKGGKYSAPKEDRRGKYEATPEERARIKYERKATKKVKNRFGANLGKPKNQQVADSRKQGYLGEIKNRNADFNDEQLKEVEAAYDRVYQKTGNVGKAMDAASAKTRQLGGTMMNSSEKMEMMSASTQKWTEGLSGAGAALLGVGTALGLLSGLFDSLGMEEASEVTSTLSQVFLGLGSALMALPGLITGVSSVATAAGISVQAAWWWLLIIAAILAVIVGLVYVIANAFEAASDAAQLEKMNEQLEDLSAAADDAKQKLDDMASAKEDLEELGDAFKGLVKGSREWKQALIENNQKVLELLNTYPQLADYVSKGVNGELVISEEGWNTMMDAQQETYTHTLGAKTAMTQQVAEKELSMKTENKMAETVGGGTRMEYAEFMESGWGKAAAIGGMTATGAAIGALAGPIGAAIGAGIGLIAGSIQAFTAPTAEEVEREQTGGLTYDELNEFGALAADRGLSLAGGSSKEEFKEVYLELGYNESDFESVWSSMNSMGTAFDELANSAMAVRQAELARVDAIASNVAQTSSIVTGSEKFGAVAEEVGARAFEDYDDQVAGKADTYLSDMDVKDLESGKAAEAIAKYAKIQGIDEAEVRRQIENDEITKETIANTIAASEVDSEMKKAMEGTVKVFEKISKGKSDKEVNKIKSLMTDRGEGLNIGALGDIEAAGSVEAYLKAQGFTEADAIEMGYQNWDEYVKAMETNYNTGLTALEDVRTQIEEAGLSFDQLPETLTAGAAQGLADKLTVVVANEGTAMAQQVLNAYEGITEGLSTEQVQAITEYMTDVDWSSTEEVEAFGEYLKSLGLNIPENEIENFTNLMKEAGNATEDLDLEKVATQITNLQKTIRNINSGEQTRTFSAEDYELIKDVLPEEYTDDFVKDLDGNFVYVGNSMSDLTAALQQNTAALLGKTADQLQTKALVGQVLGNNQAAGGIFGEDTRGLDILSTAIEHESIGSIKGSIQEVINEAIKQGLDVSYLGIEGLTNNTNLDILTPDMILSMGKQLLTIGSNQTYYEEQATEVESDNAVAAKSNYNPYGLIGDTANFGYTYFDSDSFLSQTVDWAEHLNIDMSQYQGIYSTDTEVAQAAMFDLFTKMESYMHNIGEVNNQLLNLPEGEMPQDHIFAWYSHLSGTSVEQAKEDYQAGTLTSEQMSSTFTNASTLPNGFTWMEYAYGTNPSYFVEDDIVAKHAGARHWSGGLGNETGAIYEQNPSQTNDQFVKNETYSGTISKEDADALRLQAVQYGVSEKALIDFNKAMDSGTDYQKRMTAAVLANAIEEKKQEKQYGKTLKKLEDVKEEYRTVKEGMQGYSEAIYAYGEALNLDMADSSNLEFVSENLDLIRKAAEGDIESILELNRLLAAEHGLVITADGNFDLYNSAVDVADEKTQQFIMDQYEAGAYEIVEEEVDQDMEYLAPIYDSNGMVTGFERKTAQAGQTIQMLRPQDAPSIERAQDYGGTNDGGGGGGGNNEPAENPYDKLHDDLEEINDLLRERERLERRYQRLIDQGVKSVAEIRKARQDQIDNLREENKRQEGIIKGRTNQIEEKINENPDMKKYVTVETLPNGEKTIRIDWDKINSITDQEEMDKVTEFYDEIDGWLEDIYDAEETQEDNTDAIAELLQEGKDDYLNLEEQVRDAIEKQRQDEIDSLSELNDVITETNSQLLDAMQTSIDEYRQARDNEETEEELSDKQRRLAYLQQDTSGANALEILQLQEELDEATEDYTDTLIDQKISELQKQNDEAAEQRQRQIDIMQQQLDYYLESGQVWEDVEELIAGALNEDGTVKPDSALMDLLKEGADWDSMSEIAQMDWLKDTNTMIAMGLDWLTGQGILSTFFSGQEIEFTTADGQTVKGTVQADGTVVDSEGNVYENVTWDGSSFSTTENKKVKPEDPDPPEAPEVTTNDKKGVSAAIWNGGYGWGTGSTRVKRLKEVFGDNDIQKNYVDKRVTSGYTGKISDYSYEKMKAKFKAYKTGGLADFTGPAWLDGTKSKPEYILNAEQTQGFFTLIDVLSSLRAGNGKPTENSGDYSYDIDINVESISSDYDVEQLAEKIKTMINSDARYRNNNTVNLMR